MALTQQSVVNAIHKWNLTLRSRCVLNQWQHVSLSRWRHFLFYPSPKISYNVQWNFLGQTAASGCEGFPTFQEFHPHHRDVVPETSENLHIWHGCLTEKISLNSVAAKASRLYISPIPSPLLHSAVMKPGKYSSGLGFAAQTAEEMCGRMHWRTRLIAAVIMSTNSADILLENILCSSWRVYSTVNWWANVFPVASGVICANSRRKCVLKFFPQTQSWVPNCSKVRVHGH